VCMYLSTWYAIGHFPSPIFSGYIHSTQYPELQWSYFYTATVLGSTEDIICTFSITMVPGYSTKVCYQTKRMCHVLII